MARKPWTPDERADLNRLRAEGVPNKVIARRFGRSIGSVSGAVSRYADTRQLRRPEYYRAGVRRLAGSNVTDAEIARRLGCSDSTVWYWRRQLGLSASCQPAERVRRMNAGRFQFDPARLRSRVRRLARPGVSDREIAERIGCSRVRITEVRRELGLPVGITPAERSRRSAAAKRAYTRFPRCLNCDARANKQSSIEKDGWKVVVVRTDGAKSRVVFCPACKTNPKCLEALGDQLVA